MKPQKTVAAFLPRPLLLIAAAAVPVAIACNYLAQLRDVHPAPESMSAAAVAARLTPVAHVLAAPADQKMAAAYPVMPTSN